ncbi:PE-PGRS family protein [Streptomyces celluloflavus]|uniref:PE-PGRS family protein n=1 Tax=Streptomyces celluloflavus TaxID=58344 RepID=UPI0036D77EFD
MDAGHVLRGLRAAVFAAVCVLLAALGHMAMSDAVVPWWTLLAAGAGCTAAAWCVAGRERGPVLVGVLTVGAQAALHSAFSFGQAVADTGGERLSLARQWANAWLCGAQGMPLADIEAARRAQEAGPGGRALAAAAATGTSGSGHHGGQALLDQLPGVSQPMPHPMAEGGMHGSASGMLAAHLLVALLSAWWLWGGERAAFRVVRTVSALLVAPLVLVRRIVLPDSPPGVRPRRPEPRRAVRTVLLAHVISLRGPPRGPAVV